VTWPTVGDVCERAARLFGPREAAVGSGQRLTYRQLCARATALGNGLRGRGLAAGSRVAYFGDNSVRLLEAYLGIPAAGLVLLPVNARLSPPELRYVLEDAECDTLLSDESYEDVVEEAVQGMALLRIRSGGSGYEQLVDEAPAGVRHRAQPGDTAYLYYTSGTTGRRKGVMLSHENVTASCLGVCATAGLTGTDRWLHAGPMFHLADAFAVWAFTLLGGAHVVDRFDPERTLRLLDVERATHTLLVPTAIAMLVDAAGGRTGLRSLRTLLYGGAPMPDQVLQRALAAFDAPLAPTYGTTETAGMLTMMDAAEASARAGQAGQIGSVGRETPVTRIDLYADDGTSVVGPGEVGEVVVSSPGVMRGYWRRAEESARALREGRYWTGDLASRDGDGLLTIVGRKTDMILSGGENVYAREVEEVLEEHPAIAEVAVVGAPHFEWGEAVCAVAIRRPGEAVPSLEELRTWGRDRLAGYMLPLALRWVDEMPRTATGKVAKAELRRQMGHTEGEASVTEEAR
jgi:long-chain acyl-CoA synthetase